MKVLFLLLLPFSLMAQNLDANKLGSTKAMTLVNSFNAGQKEIALFSFDDMSRYLWHYVPGSMLPRNGISIKDLDSTQKKFFYSLFTVPAAGK